MHSPYTTPSGNVHGMPLAASLGDVYFSNKINDIDDARTILLDEIERFITMGRPEGKSGNDNKYTGSIFVLTALVEVSPTAAIVMPHLVPIV